MSNGRTITWAQARSLVMRIELRAADDLRAWCRRWHWTGSFRRRRPTVSDLDLVIEPRDGVEIARIGDMLRRLAEGHELVLDGPQKKALLLSKCLVKLEAVIAKPPHADLLSRVPGTWGACIMTTTGGLAHNIALCERAKSRGMRYAPFIGLLSASTGLPVAGETERGIYHALGMEWIPPARRD